MATPLSQLDNSTKQLIRRYGNRIRMTEQIRGSKLSDERRSALAHALYNTEKAISLSESTNPGNIGQFKRYALDIINAVVPNLISFDLVAVQPMDNRIGMINYLDYKYSKSKGQTQAGDIYNSSLNMGKSDYLYTSDRVEDQPIGKKGLTQYGTEDAPMQLGWYPIDLSTFSVSTDGGEVVGYADPVSGEISGIGVTGKVTVDGLLFLTFDSATTEQPIVSYNFNNEDVRSDGPVGAGFTNVPEVELKINSLPVRAAARTLRAYWAFDAAFELQKEYGQDIESLLSTSIAGELAHEIDTELSLDLLKGANAGRPITWSRKQAVGISLLDHYDSFNVKLNEGSNIIYGATRKVYPNFIVAGLDVCAVISSMRNFTPAGTHEPGPHFLGTLNEYKVFANPDYPSKEFVMGYKGSNQFDAGYFYCPYMPISSTDLITDANFRGQRGWATMYGKKLVNSSMYLRGFITD